MYINDLSTLEVISNDLTACASFQEHNEIVAQLKEQKKKEEEREQRKAEKEQRLREELDRQPVTAAAGLAYSAATKKKSKWVHKLDVYVLFWQTQTDSILCSTPRLTT